MSKFDTEPVEVRNFINEFGYASYEGWLAAPKPKIPLSLFAKKLRERQIPQ